MAVAGKFGRRAPRSREEAPRVMIDNYVDFEYRTSLPKPPPLVSRSVSSWPMYLNDQLGDCTEAAKAHTIQALTAYGTGTELSVTDKQVLKWYERDGGYVPGDPSTDNGCIIQDVLTNWQADDSAVCPITEFGELDNFYTIANVKEALYLFGSVYLGINCPQSMLDQFNAGEPLTYVPGSPIVGGHAIVLQEVTQTGTMDMLQVVTWGEQVKMNRAFWHHYVEEAWVVISPDWFNSSGVDTDGFDLAALQADFAQLAQRA